MGFLTSQERLQAFVAGCGAAGALVFMAFQAVQVVVPILPGGLGCLAGVLLFGAVNGFVYNYIGICVGSLMAFAIARSCGKPLLPLLFSEKTIAKYSAWTEDRGRFSKLFAWAIFLPVAPDDFLCYLAGTTEMTWRRFTAIILLGKPFATEEKDLRLNFPDAEIKEAYRNGQPAVLKIVINGISETLFLVKKNGGYAATKTLPSLTTV